MADSTPEQKVAGLKAFAAKASIHPSLPITEELKSIGETLKNISEKEAPEQPEPLSEISVKGPVEIKLPEGENGELAAAFFNLLKGKQGNPGKNYTLTDDDKREIATQIKVPVVKQVIKETETIKEVPIVTEVHHTTQEIKEVAVADSPEQLVKKLESLEGEGRLDKSAIRGLTDLEENIDKKISKIPRGGGARGIQLYVNGGKKGLATMFNLIPGTNVSFTYDYANGRNDLTINATGGGSASFSVITVSGTVNDTNKSFTASTTPVLVIINGTSYRTTGDSITWTYVGSALTLSQAVGSGGSIYAIG